MNWKGSATKQAYPKLSNYPSIFLEGFTTPDTYLMINDVWAPI
jgi:hypothetical protein